MLLDWLNIPIANVESYFTFYTIGIFVVIIASSFLRLLINKYIPILRGHAEDVIQGAVVFSLMFSMLLIPVYIYATFHSSDIGQGCGRYVGTMNWCKDNGGMFMCVNRTGINQPFFPKMPNLTSVNISSFCNNLTDS